MNDAFNKSLISEHEGNRLEAYLDTRGILTIGRGFNLHAPGAAKVCAQCGVDYAAIQIRTPPAALTLEIASQVARALVAAEARGVFPSIDSYPQNAAAVICDMIFQLGLGGFKGFHNTIDAFKAEDWAGVIDGLLASELAKQVPQRVQANVLLLHAIPPAPEA